MSIQISAVLPLAQEHHIVLEMATRDCFYIPKSLKKSEDSLKINNGFGNFEVLGSKIV